MTDEAEARYTTRVETNRWESFTRLTFAYFVDQSYEVEQRFQTESGSYELVFSDEEREEHAVFVYNGSPPDFAQESFQGMQKFFEGSANVSKFWSAMLGQSDDS